MEQERAEPSDEELGGGQSGSWCRSLLERGEMQRQGETQETAAIQVPPRAVCVHT